MRFCATGLVLPSAFALVLACAGGAAADPFENARNASREGHFPEALASLDSAIASNPPESTRDFEFLLLRARIHGWQGLYDLADRELLQLDSLYHGDDEIRRAQADLLYYRGRFAESEALFKELLREDPGSEDVAEGLARVRLARAEASKRWRIDAGAEYSAFTRRDQPGWGEGFVQVGRSLDARTMVSLRGEAWRQFGLVDAALEAGVSHRFSDRLNAAVQAGWTPDADFKPQWRLAGDLGLRCYGSNAGAAQVWLLANAWYDRYASGGIMRTSPGVRLEGHDPRDLPWALTARALRIDAEGRDPLYGWSARLDGPLPAGVRFYTGAGDAPETVVFGTGAATVATFTLFAGVIVPLGSDLALDAGYSRDDRENAYIRHAFHAAVSQRF